jgi:hypothetical protein
MTVNNRRSSLFWPRLKALARKGGWLKASSPGRRIKKRV